MAIRPISTTPPSDRGNSDPKRGIEADPQVRIQPDPRDRKKLETLSEAP